MADYISTLTGVQMDAALIDMAEHNSEAFAVGERNGIAVTTDDVTYHNNARYYAQQAQSIAPASVTEAVRWDVAQTALTDANRLQARENIKATSHNYNLVDNGWFNVNSRNVNGAVNGGQTGLDRWVVNASASNSVTMATGSITLPSAGYEVIQYLNDMTSTYGKYVTLSVRDNSGNIYSASVIMPTTPSVQNYINSTQSGIRMRLRYMNPYWWVMLDASSAGADKIITAVKLELGSFSTLENDPIPDYATELARCIYSTANTADTYANNGFGRSNENLLMNPWFTINQRGTTTASTNNAYIADRWKVSGNTFTWTYGRAALSVTNAANSLTYLVQPIETALSDDINSKTVTFSVKASGTVYHTTFTWDKSARNAAVTIPNLANVFFWYGANGEVCLRFTTNGTWTINAVKLELGTVSTLANDTPPDYGTELLKCQYYFRRISASTLSAIDIAFVSATTRADIINAGHSIPMRATPTLTYSGTVNVYNGGTNHGVTAIAVVGYNTGFNLTFTSTGLTANSIGFISLNGTIDLSADL